MKVFVISLKKSEQRKLSVDRQLKASGVEYSFFDAVDGHQGYENFFEAYDETEYLLNTGRVASAGEIGCYASHLALWKKCVELNEPIMIMEDDFNAASNFSAAYEQVCKLIHQYGFIRLQTETKGLKKKVKDAGDFTLYYYKSMPHSLMCYGINPEIARVFVQDSNRLVEPVDVYVKKIWVHKQTLFGLYPYTVDVSTNSSETTIKRGSEENKTLAIKIRRFGRKIKWVFERLIFNLSQP